MKILLINPPGWQKGSTNLGLCYLAGNLIASGHKVLIFDLNATEELYETAAIKVEKYSPDIIGFSLKTSTANAAFLISKEIKKCYKKAVHVAGGPHITLDYEGSLLENPEIEYCFLGESDISFIDFVNRLEKKQSIKEVAGIAYLDNGNVVATKQKLIEKLDNLPYPSFEAIENFSFKDFRYPIITSRGCPYLCTYCCVGLICGKKWRARTPENTVTELKNAREKFGVKTFEILDDNFTLRLDRAKQLCRLIIKNKVKLNWYCHNGIRADRIDFELARLMKKAGCTSIALGIESGNAEVFNNIKKGETFESIVNAVKYIKKAGMRVVGYFIIGLPGDSLNGIKKTIEFQQRLGLDGYTYGILNPYPHTEVYEIIKRDGKILMDIKDSSHFSSTLTIPFEMPGFSKEDMKEAHYLCKFQKLYKALEVFKKKYNKKLKRILYINFSADLGFLENLAHFLDSYELDVFCSPWKSDDYFKYKEAMKIQDLRAFKYSPYFFKNLKNILRLFNIYRKRKYDILFYNLRAQKKMLLLALLIIHPKTFYLEAEDGYRILTIKDKEIREFFFKKIKELMISLPKLTISILASFFFRISYIFFGLFLYFKRNGQIVEFSTPNSPLKMKDKESK